MKKWILVAGLLVLLLGALKMRETSLHEAPDSSVSVNQTQVKKSLGEYLRQSRGDYQALVEASPQIPKACSESFTQIEALDFSAGSTVQYQMLPLLNEKCVIEDEGYRLAEKDFLDQCVRSKPDPTAVLNDECGAALFLLRASMTRVLLKDKKISEVKDLKQLTDLLFAEFVGRYDEHHTPDFGRINEVANQMLEQNSNLYVAAKVAAFTDLMKGMERQGQSDWQRAEASLARAQRLNPSDPNLADVEAAIQTRGFEPQKTIDVANSMIQKNQNDDRALFLLAYGQWKSGDRQTSIQNLQRAIELNPQRGDYRQVMTAITRPNADVDSFKGSMSVVVSNEDFTP